VALPTLAREPRQARKGATVSVSSVWRGLSVFFGGFGANPPPIGQSPMGPPSRLRRDVALRARPATPATGRRGPCGSRSRFALAGRLSPVGDLTLPPRLCSRSLAAFSGWRPPPPTSAAARARASRSLAAFSGWRPHPPAAALLALLRLATSTSPFRRGSRSRFALAGRLLRLATSTSHFRRGSRFALAGRLLRLATSPPPSAAARASRSLAAFSGATSTSPFRRGSRSRFALAGRLLRLATSTSPFRSRFALAGRLLSSATTPRRGTARACALAGRLSGRRPPPPAAALLALARSLAASRARLGTSGARVLPTRA